MSFASSRLRTATHAVCVIAYNGTLLSTSEMIAQSVGTTGSVIRRILSDLCIANIINGSTGRNGGYCLAKPPSKISLKDIFVAVEPDEIFPNPARTPSDSCPVGTKIQYALSQPMKLARSDVELSLSKTNIETLMKHFKRS